MEVIDCASQSSLAHWTLRQWAEYYQSPDRDKVRNVISLEVSETRLGKMVVAPELVRCACRSYQFHLLILIEQNEHRKLDWVDNVWPEDMKLPGQYPRVQKYCLMSVARCWTVCFLTLHLIVVLLLTNETTLGLARRFRGFLCFLPHPQRRKDILLYSTDTRKLGSV